MRSAQLSRRSGACSTLALREDDHVSLKRVDLLVPQRRQVLRTPERSQDLDWLLCDADASQTTSVRTRAARTTLWALCTAIPIQALR
jgi:hypothetical protein